MGSPFDLAAQQIGLNENEKGPAIQEYLRNGGQNLDPSVTAWCAAFVNSTINQSGGSGTDKLNARSFMKWGQPVDTPQRGDVAVFSRGDPKGWQGHVGFFDSFNDDGRINVLGGNQNDGVNISPYDKSRLLGFRRPGSPVGATPQPTIGSQAMQVLGKTLPEQQQRGILATPQKGPEPMQQQQPRGLLGSMGIQKMQEGAEGETGQRFYQRDSFKDTAAKMGQAFAALGSNPGVQKFTNDVANQRTETKSRNKTVEYLRANGMADMADMVEAGNLPAGGVLSAIIQKRMATPKDNRTTAQLEYAGAKAQGYGGSFMDYKTDLAKSGAINLGGQDVQIVEGKMVVPDSSDPSGYKLVPFGGSKAALAAAEGASRQIVTEKIKGDKATVVNRDIDRLVTMIDGGGTFDLPETGILGGALGKLGVNQEAVDFKNTLASIQGTIAFDTLAKMREASKTGGALGAVSEREIDLLISAFGALQQNTDPTILRENLIDIKRVMGKIENDPVARSMAYGGAGAGAVTDSTPENDDPLNLFGN